VPSETEENHEMPPSEQPLFLTKIPAIARSVTTSVNQLGG
jgi:hypothetical protein